jgi:hypothetical protein
MPGPASPLASAVSTIEDVSSTEVGYCSSSILGLAKIRLGIDERQDSGVSASSLVVVQYHLIRDNIIHHSQHREGEVSIYVVSNSPNFHSFMLP